MEPGLSDKLTLRPNFPVCMIYKLTHLLSYLQTLIHTFHRHSVSNKGVPTIIVDTMLHNSCTHS